MKADCEPLTRSAARAVLHLVRVRVRVRVSVSVRVRVRVRVTRVGLGLGLGLDQQLDGEGGDELIVPDRLRLVIRVGVRVGLGS